MKINYEDIKMTCWSAVTAVVIGKLMCGVEVFSVTLIPANTSLVTCALAGALPVIAFFATVYLLEPYLQPSKSLLTAPLIMGPLAAPGLTIYAVSVLTTLPFDAALLLPVCGAWAGWCSQYLKTPVEKLRPGLSDYLLFEGDV